MFAITALISGTGVLSSIKYSEQRPFLVLANVISTKIKSIKG